MVWIYYKFARVEQNCGKQRQLKQLPDEMWKRKPMSGRAGTYPVSAKPKHKVYGAADSQDVGSEPVVATKVAATRSQESDASRETCDPGTAKTDWVSFMIKLLRAYGGCLGARRR